ncbi:MAG: ribonuclease H-like domain-containing protein [Spirochaetaceae bacterium]
MSDLYRRLKAAKERGEAPREGSSPGGRRQRPFGQNSGGADWRVRRREEPPLPRERRAPAGFTLSDGVYLRRQTVRFEELAPREQRLGAEEPVHIPPRLAPGVRREEAEVALPLGSHLFFDLEATGLSTGAGNVAFLLGLGHLSRDGLELVQWLLPDYPYEPEFLASVTAELHQLEERLGPVTLVSYNGRSFDTPLLQTRMLMNGIPFEPPRELDLLPISRRFWRGELENCSLGSVEERVLAVERELDIPGAYVPLRYFDYLRSGRPEPLLEVVAHHRQDVVSLYLLLCRIELILRGAPGLPGRGPDQFELAKLLIEREPLPEGRKRGEGILRELALEGKSERGALYFGRYLRRSGDPATAYEVWIRAFRLRGSVAAGIMAAKMLEHEFREYEKALSLVEELLAKPESSPRLTDALLHRQERLRRRSASS